MYIQNIINYNYKQKNGMCFWNMETDANPLRVTHLPSYKKEYVETQ